MGKVKCDLASINAMAQRLVELREAEGRCPVCGGTAENPGLGYSAFGTQDGRCATPFHGP